MTTAASPHGFWLLLLLLMAINCCCLQIPTVGFLYIAGWIGYAGRTYLNLVKQGGKAQEKEYIIDVPTAIRIAFQGAGWPVQVVQELRAGTLTERAENITVSPRYGKIK